LSVLCSLLSALCSLLSALRSSLMLSSPHDFCASLRHLRPWPPILTGSLLCADK
jgi:hypothetical protein